MPRPNGVVASKASVPGTEQGSDLVLGHTIEVVGHRYLAGEEPQPVRLRGRVQRYNFDNRLACPGDYEGFALCGLVDESGELGFCFVDVDRNHFVRTKVTGLEPPSHVETIGLRIALVNVAESTFEFANLFIRDVIKDFVGRERRPSLSLAFTVFLNRPLIPPRRPAAAV